ncbi:MAG: hypothetical protein NZ534_12430, partial [Bacteroidia bacterium]|nr:hypothetical protein [Bacteroidia bacterium]
TANLAGACGVGSLNVTFSRPVTCATLQASDFQLTGPGGAVTITGVSGIGCSGGGQYTDAARITYSTAGFQSGNHTLSVTGTISGVCGGSVATGAVGSQNITQPQITGAETPRCPGDPVTLTAPSFPAAVYSWSTGQGGQSITVNPEVPTTYAVTITSQGCSQVVTVQVNVLPIPVVTTDRTNVFLCNAQTSVAVTASAIPNNNPTFVWNGPGLNNATGATQNLSQSGTYEVRAVVNGCTSAVRTVTVVNVDATTPAPNCEVIHVTPNGSSTAAGTASDPTNLQEALIRSQCRGATIRLAGSQAGTTYTINNAITNITNNVTIEGGFDPVPGGWIKRSNFTSRILRTANNVQVQSGNRYLSAIELDNVSGFRLQDVTVEVEDAPAATG